MSDSENRRVGEVFHVRTVREPCAVYGTCIGRFDGRRSFLVMNYRSRLEVYENHVVLLDPDQESEVVNYKARPVLASVLHSKGKRHAHAIIVVPADPSKRAEKDDASSSKTSKDSLLVLYVDHSKGKHYWSLLRWDDEGSAFGGVGHAAGEGPAPGKAEVVCGALASFRVPTRGAREGSPVHLAAYAISCKALWAVRVSGSEVEARAIASGGALWRLLRPPRCSGPPASCSRILGVEVLRSQRDFSAGRLSVALLVTTHDPPTEQTDLRTVALALPRSGTWGGTLGESGSTQSLEAGPFTCENLDPTTAVLCACDTENGPEVVAVSSQGMDRFWEDEVGGEFRSHRKEAAMGGVPTCARYVRELGILLVGETSGGVHCIGMLPKGHGAMAARVHRSDGLAFPPPSSLELLPSPSPAQDMTNAEEERARCHELVIASAHGATEWLWISSHGPVTAKPLVIAKPAGRVSEGSGAVVDACCSPGHGGDAVVSCGGAAGHAVAARTALGLSLRAVAEAEGAVPEEFGRPDLVAVDCGKRSFVLFSFEAQRRTLAMECSDGGMRPAEVPGLEHLDVTLCATSPGTDLILQATAGEVRLACLEQGRAIARWSAAEQQGQGFIGSKHAAACGSRVAVSLGGGVVQGLRAWNRKIQPLARVHLEREVSCLALAECELGCDDVTLLLAGEWMTNAVVVLEFQQMEELLRIDPLGPGQPRSLALVSGGRSSLSHLYVGTALGTVHLVPFSAEDGELCIEVEEADTAHVGQGPIDLTLVPVEPKRLQGGVSDSKSMDSRVTCVYARSDVDESVVFVEGRLAMELRSALQEAGEEEAGGAAWLEVRACRVGGSREVSAIVAAPTNNGCVAWLDRNGCLRVGSLDWNDRASRNVLPLRRTAMAVAHHEPSDTAVFVTEDEEGRSWLDLVDSTTTERKAGLRMHEGHVHTALAVASVAGKLCVVTCGLAVRDAALVEGNCLRPAQVCPIASFYQVGRKFDTKVEGSDTVDREVSLIGAHSLGDACNSVCDCRHPRLGAEDLLVLGCNSSLVILRLTLDASSHAGKGGQDEALADITRRLNAMETRVASGEWNPSLVGGGASARAEGEPEPRPAAAAKGKGRGLAVSELCRRDQRHPISRVRRCGGAESEFVASDLQGNVVVYRLREAEGEGAHSAILELVPACRYSTGALVLDLCPIEDGSSVLVSDALACRVLQVSPLLPLPRKFGRIGSF